ncbi:aldose 1-epimerase [Larkinella arboricola]|uniref:Aldose 1-epimerase n=1 Tax=Larkinella arboricola TaxID=643671 RepID=A0A327WTH8_LARAB|nr:aldose 1-epimerase [Larkinella arboricola]RAJ94331.1 aldose 1-epimerase [Larkinella arboricola]
MPFEILHQPFGELTEYFIQNPETEEFVSILPAYGAVVRQLVLRHPGSEHEPKRVSLIKGPQSQQALMADEGYSNALLFPFPSRIRHGIYSFEGETFTLPMNEAKQDHAIHGFVAGKPFELVGQQISDTEASLTLGYIHDGSYPGYPFQFDFRITYTLSVTGLSVTYEVKNTGHRSAPVSFGWHPYFTLNEEPIDELTIELPGVRQIRLDDNLLPTGDELLIEKGEVALRDRVLDAAFVVEDQTGEGATTVLRSARQNLALNIWQETGPQKFNYLVVFTAVARDKIAIEPLISNVNAFNNEQGLIKLAPNETTRGTIRVSVS